MGKIKVTNSATGKVESKDLDAEGLLTETRKKLGALMKEDDVFLDKKDKPITEENEKKTKLKDIIKNSSIKIAKEQDIDDTDEDEEEEEEEEVDGPGTKDPDNAASFGGTDGVLKPKVLPEAKWAEDHVGLRDGLKDGELVEGDKVTQMKVGQVRNLLRANRIDLNREKSGIAFGIAPGFVDGDAASYGQRRMRCNAIKSR